MYLSDAYGPLAFPGPAFWAAVDQARNEPFEWKQGGEGYGRRFGSKFGRNGIESTIEFGVGAIHGEDLRYRPSQRKGLLARSYDAAFQTIFPMTTRGRRTLSVARLGGAFGSGLISNAWYPDRRSNWGDGLLRGASALGGDVGVNVFREFWPDIKKKFLHRK
ncbi:MAG: hypothetical protein HY238_03025 [Acidobacteria bacterium]|nr:hypothetical protein [Acidobacteriota bacterium]